MKNETDVLGEWLDHYAWQGVDKIFLIDNGSTDDPQSLIRSHPFADHVELFSRPEPHLQSAHYREVFNTARIARQVEWLAMADLDEFWYSPAGNIKTAIRGIESHFDLLYSNWAVYGSSGRIQQPASIREGFVHRQPQLGPNVATKWICRTSAIGPLLRFDLHKVDGISSRRVVWGNADLKLNHYPIQSEDYFRRVKMTRGDAMTASSDRIRDMEYFCSYDALATVIDTELADLVVASRKMPA